MSVTSPKYFSILWQSPSRFLKNIFVFKALSDFFFILQKSLSDSIFWHPHYLLARISAVQTK